MDAAFEAPAPRTSVPLRAQQCGTEVVAPSACLQAAAKANNTAYRTACEAAKPPNRLTTLMAWERSAAQAELAVLFDQVRKIGESCPFKDWTGTVTITVAEEQSSNTPLAAPAKGRDIVKNTSQRVATILVLDGRAVGEVKETSTLFKSHNASGETTCPKNPRPVPFTESSEETSRVDGDIFKPAAVTVSFNRNQYRLSATSHWRMGIRSDVGEIQLVGRLRQEGCEPGQRHRTAETRYRWHQRRCDGQRCRYPGVARRRQRPDREHAHAHGGRSTESHERHHVVAEASQATELATRPAIQRVSVTLSIVSERPSRL